MRIPFLRRIFCAHDPIILTEKRIPSEVEELVAMGRTPNTHCSLKVTHVVLMKCSKCGTLIERKYQTAGL